VGRQGSSVVQYVPCAYIPCLVYATVKTGNDAEVYTSGVVYCNSIRHHGRSVMMHLISQKEIRVS